jgi:hypothetical protein
MKAQMSDGAHNTCAEALFMQVALSPNAAGYLALWSWTGKNPWAFTSTTGGPYSEEIWSTTVITPQNTGVNVHYDVPRGNGAWFVAAGGGPGPCQPKIGIAQAWVVTSKHKVSGQVTVAGSGGIAAAQIAMRANCSGGGTTTTNSKGYYAFLVNSGPCTVAPQLVNGVSPTPLQRVLNVTSDIDNVNFSVPCDALVVPLPAVTGRAAGACDLRVLITGADGSTPKHAASVVSGLAYPSASFLAGSGYGSCVSACTDFDVLVTTASGDPVEGAGVTVTVDPLAPLEPDYPRVWAPGTDLTNPNLTELPVVNLAAPNHGYLCDRSAVPSAPDCGEMLYLATNSQGIVKLRYWSSGVTTVQTVALTAKAEAIIPPCSGCASVKVFGADAAKITVRPNVVINDHSGQLTDYERYIFTKWATANPSIFDKEYDAQVGNLITTAVTFLFTEEGEALLNATQNADKYVGSKDRAEIAMVALVLDTFRAEEAGLGVISTDTSTPLWPAIADYSFQEAFGNMLKDYGEKLYGAYQLDRDAPPEGQPTMHLEVDEVSFCELGKVCGEDYSCGSVNRCDGIEPYLFIYFYVMRPADADADETKPQLFYSQDLVVPYRADTWMKEQKGVETAAPLPNPSSGG